MLNNVAPSKKNDPLRLIPKNNNNEARTLKSTKSFQRNSLYFTSLCLAFIICSLPLSSFNILLDMFFDSNWIQQKEKMIYWSIIVLTTLELTHIIVSPILYGYMNQNFRQELIKLKGSFGKKIGMKSTKTVKIEVNKNEIV